MLAGNTPSHRRRAWVALYQIGAPEFWVSSRGDEGFKDFGEEAVDFGGFAFGRPQDAFWTPPYVLTREAAMTVLVQIALLLLEDGLTELISM